jgi:methylated-DNA-[protein]-cysteine S-methyltransferase
MREDEDLSYVLVDSPVGELLLAGDDTALKLISFQTGRHQVRPASLWKADDHPFEEVVRQLRAYFEGNLKTFDLALAPDGTPFQLAVWRALQEIPYGETISYGELARRVGSPQASRAVGAANGRNPLPIVIPCHRVIGGDGSLTGYGGGLRIKRTLLDLERRHSGTRLPGF